MAHIKEGDDNVIKFFDMSRATDLSQVSAPLHLGLVLAEMQPTQVV